MDAKNDVVWEEAIARVVTVEAELITAEGTETLSRELICYNGYFARPWTLKGGAPKTGNGFRSIGFENLYAEFSTGAILDIDMPWLCQMALETEIEALPLKVGSSRASIVIPRLSMYCEYPYSTGVGDSLILFTDTVRLGYPYIVAMQDRPLQQLSTRKDLGSSEASESPIAQGFRLRWGVDIYRNSVRWRDNKRRWDSYTPSRDETITYYCGENPR